MSANVKDRRDAKVVVESGDEALWTENALRVLRARYLRKDETGRPTEAAVDLFRRVARTVAAAEKDYGISDEQCREIEERFYHLMVSGDFLPNSPTLMNAGREMGMLSACFVLPVGDSIDEIFDSVKHTALIQKAGGGTGFAFDGLRPTGDYIRSSGGTTSGPISFWRVFSEATNAIQQGAFRRGANMGMMYIHHPDILKFLYAKQDLTQFTNYNISVKVTDEWMDAFLADPDSPHVLRNPRNGAEFYAPKALDIERYDIHSLIPVTGDLGPLTCTDGAVEVEVDGSPVAVYSRADVWKIIVEHAWQTGEPGVVFIDRLNEFNPTPHVGRIEATNPCGEQPLLPYEACNLGSINLGRFVTNPCTDEADVDWDRLRETIDTSVRFLDDIIDVNEYPLPEIEQMCRANRKIGLGIMGFADALFKLGVRYSSDEGVACGERLMQFVNDTAHDCSECLAVERGCFPNWKGSIWDTEFHRPMRNAATTTVAPTGTISIIADCSAGIEPLFSLAFYRNVLKGQDGGNGPMIQTNAIFEQVAKAKGFYSEGLMEKIATEGTLAVIDDVPDDVKHVFVCAHDVTPEWHMRMQAGYQKHCDASISKTINFSHDAEKGDVDHIYRMAYDLRCKGVTVYRDGCRSEQPMALSSSESKHQAQWAGQSAADAEPVMLEPRDLPEIVSGLRIRQMTPFGNMHVKITVDPVSERELEVFAQLGKGGDVATSDLEAICRMISLWLRSGGGLNHVIQQLKDIGSSLQVATKDGRIMSLGDGLARALMRYQRAKEMFGLHDLLLGQADLSQMDRSPFAGRTHTPSPSVAPRKKNGNGNGSGHGKGNGHGRRLEVRHAKAADVVREGGSYGSLGDAGLPTRANAFKVKCPECGENLMMAEGCRKCVHCGYAAC
ncbi:MAG: vitamin B12-dependent ribonucleotide reductase [Phycisphaerae bacterium]|nr:vitamin B12-dependent ribonucleotide reductase [Phycisphaerae bacterium]